MLALTSFAFHSSRLRRVRFAQGAAAPHSLAIKTWGCFSIFVIANERYFMDTIINFIHSIDDGFTNFVLSTLNNQDPITDLALMFGIPTLLAAGLVWGFELLKYLNERFEYFNLIRKIKTNPKDADTLIQNSDYHFSIRFIQKYASESLIFKREISDAKIYANRNADFVALDTYKNLELSYNNIIQKRKEVEQQRKAEKRKKTQAEKLELLTNQASQALDDVWN